mgnify:CR=1 FL=1
MAGTPAGVLTAEAVRSWLSRVGAVRRPEYETSRWEHLYWSERTSTWYMVRADRGGYRVGTQAGCGACS